MKINTISAYLLVYLLARGHWNLMVPVRADDADGTTGSASADAGSATNGAAEASALAAQAADGGSTAGTDAGLTSPDASADGAGADADASAGSPADGTSTGDASADPSLTVSTGADGTVASSADGTGSDADASSSEGAEANAEAELSAKKEAAKRLAENAKKAAEDAKNAADEMLKAAEALSQAIDTATDVAALHSEMEKLSATVEAKVYEVNVGKSKLDDVAKPPDMMYYNGFPDGHHRYDAGAYDLIVRENNWANSITNYAGFPDGNHRYDHGADDLIAREDNWANSLTYYSGFPDGWHFGNPLVLRDIRRHELKVEIDAKKSELDHVKKQIDELTVHFNLLDTVVKNLEEEHNELIQKMLGFDALLIKLYKTDSDNNLVELVDNTDFEKKKAHGDLRFEFKAGVKCTKVKYGKAEVWKKGERDVDEPKLVAFNASMGVIAVRDNDRAVLFKKEANSDEWKHHNTILRKTGGSTGSRAAAHTGSAAPTGTAASTLASSATLAGSKSNLDSASTGTPESPDSLEETSSVASGDGNELTEGESGSSTSLRGSSERSSEGGSSGDGSAGQGHGSSSGEFSSVFMD